MTEVTSVLRLRYERIKKKVMEMSLEDLRDYVIYQMIEDENKYDPNYDDEEFFDWLKKKQFNDCFLSYIQNILYLLYSSSSFVES